MPNFKMYNEQIKLMRINSFTVCYGLEAFCQNKNIDFDMFKQKLIETLGCDIYQPDEEEDAELLTYDEHILLKSELISKQFIVRGKFNEKYINNIIKQILLNETSYNLIPKRV